MTYAKETEAGSDEAPCPRSQIRSRVKPLGLGLNMTFKSSAFTGSHGSSSNWSLGPFWLMWMRPVCGSSSHWSLRPRLRPLLRAVTQLFIQQVAKAFPLPSLLLTRNKLSWIPASSILLRMLQGSACPPQSGLYNNQDGCHAFPGRAHSPCQYPPPSPILWK